MQCGLSIRMMLPYKMRSLRRPVSRQGLTIP